MTAEDKEILSPSTSLCQHSHQLAPFTLFYQEHLTPTTATEGLSRQLEGLWEGLKTGSEADESPSNKFKIVIVNAVNYASEPVCGEGADVFCLPGA